MRFNRGVQSCCSGQQHDPKALYNFPDNVNRFTRTFFKKKKRKLEINQMLCEVLFSIFYFHFKAQSSPSNGPPQRLLCMADSPSSLTCGHMESCLQKSSLMARCHIQVCIKGLLQFANHTYLLSVCFLTFQDRLIY